MYENKVIFAFFWFLPVKLLAELTGNKILLYCSASFEANMLFIYLIFFYLLHFFFYGADNIIFIIARKC